MKGTHTLTQDSRELPNFLYHIMTFRNQFLVLLEQPQSNPHVKGVTYKIQLTGLFTEEADSMSGKWNVVGAGEGEVTANGDRFLWR